MHAKMILSTLSTKPILCCLFSGGFENGGSPLEGVFIYVDSIRLYMYCVFIGRGLMESAFITFCIENGLHDLQYYGYSNSPNAPSILLFR